MASFEELERLVATHFGEHQLTAFRDPLTLRQQRPAYSSAPPRILIILFSSRSGSSFAGRLLTKTPYFNGFGEQFNADQLRYQRRQFELPDDMAAVEYALEHDGTEHAFGAKCGVPGMVGALYTGFLPALLDRIRFITLRRRDSIGQAVSMAKAKLSGQYSAKQEAKRTVSADDYDRALIASCLGQLTMANRHLESLAGALPNQNLLIDYEDISADPQGFVDVALDHIELPRAAIGDNDTGLKKQRDSINAEWRARFEEESEERTLHFLREIRPIAPGTGWRSRPGILSGAARLLGRKPARTRDAMLEAVARQFGAKRTRKICDAIPIGNVAGFHAPEHLLCMLATPQSGASRAGLLLAETPYFNNVTEAFAPAQLDAMRDYTAKRGWREAAQLVVELQGTGMAFAMKGGFELLAGAAHVGFLHEMVDRLAFVRLRRRDAAQQAVALFRRRQARKDRAAAYDGTAIADIADGLSRREAQLDAFLKEIGRPATTFWFEDEWANPSAFVDRLCAEAGLAPPGIETTVDETDGNLDEDWIRRFAAGER